MRIPANCVLAMLAIAALACTAASGAEDGTTASDHGQPAPTSGTRDKPAATTGESGGSRTLPEALLIPVGPERRNRKQSLLVMEPRALGYRFISEHVSLSSGHASGTRINLENDLDVANQVFLAPQVNSEINLDVLGFMTRFQFTYISHDLHGIAMAKKDLWFGGRNFSAGTVIGTHVVHRRMRLRYIQDILRFPWIEADISLGAEYFYFYHRLDAPGFAVEDDLTENTIPVPGCRIFLVPWQFCRVFADVEGFGWNLGADMGMTATLNCTIGVWIKFTETWGFVLDFSLRWIMMREGDASKVDLLFFEFGPGIAIYASL